MTENPHSTLSDNLSASPVVDSETSEIAAISEPDVHSQQLVASTHLERQLSSPWLKRFLRIAAIGMLGTVVTTGVIGGASAVNAHNRHPQELAQAMQEHNMREVLKLAVQSDADSLANEDPVVSAVLVKAADRFTDQTALQRKLSALFDWVKIGLAGNKEQAAQEAQQQFAAEDKIDIIQQYVQTRLKDVTISQADDIPQYDEKALDLPVPAHSFGCDVINSRAWCDADGIRAMHEYFGPAVAPIVKEQIQKYQLTDQQDQANLEFIVFNYVQAYTSMNNNLPENFSDFMAAYPDNKTKIDDLVKSILQNDQQSQDAQMILAVAQAAGYTTPSQRLWFAVRVIRQEGAFELFDSVSGLAMSQGDQAGETELSEAVDVLRTANLKGLPMAELGALANSSSGQLTGLLDYFTYSRNHLDKNPNPDAWPNSDESDVPIYPNAMVGFVFETLHLTAADVQQLADANQISLMQAYMALFNPNSSVTIIDPDTPQWMSAQATITTSLELSDKFKTTLALSQDQTLEILNRHDLFFDTNNQELLTALANYQLLGFDNQILTLNQKLWVLSGLEGIVRSGVNDQEVIKQKFLAVKPELRTQLAVFLTVGVDSLGMNLTPDFLDLGIDKFNQFMAENSNVLSVAQLQKLNHFLSLYDQTQFNPFARILNINTYQTAAFYDGLLYYLTTPDLRESFDSVPSTTEPTIDQIKRVILTWEASFRQSLMDSVSQLYPDYFDELPFSGMVGKLDLTHARAISLDEANQPVTQDTTGLEIDFNPFFLGAGDGTLLAGKGFDPDVLDAIDGNGVITLSMLQNLSESERQQLFASRWMLMISSDGTVQNLKMSDAFQDFNQGVQQVEDSQLAFSYVPLTEIDSTGKVVPLNTQTAAAIQESATYSNYVVVAQDSQGKLGAYFVALTANYLPAYWDSLNAYFAQKGLIIQAIVASDMGRGVQFKLGNFDQATISASQDKMNPLVLSAGVVEKN